MPLGISSGGIGLPFVQSSGGGTPPAAFDPGGIFLSQNTEFGIRGSALGVTNSMKGTAFYWLKGTYGSGNGNDYNLGLVNLVSNNDAGATTSEDVNGFNNIHDGTFRMNLNEAHADGSNTGHRISIGSTTGLVYGPWNAFLVTWDWSTTPRTDVFYRWTPGTGWVQVANTDGSASPTGPINLNYAGGFSLNASTVNTPNLWGCFAISQLFMDLQNCIADSAGTISAPNLAKFVSGSGPVDFGADGSTPFGRQPEIYRYGNKTGFTTNRGTHTATLAVINSGPNAFGGALYDAPYGAGSPPPGRAVIEWVGSNAALAGANSSVTVNNALNAIAVGDLLVACVLPTDLVAGVANPVTGPAGWTTTAGFQTNYSSGGEGGQVAILYKFADSGDVTASGVQKDYAFTTGHPATFGNNVLLFCVKGADPTNPFDAQNPVFKVNASGVGLIAPDITPNSANCTLINLWSQDSRGLNLKVRVGAVGNEFFNFQDYPGTGFNGPVVMGSFEYITGSGAPGTRTATTSTATVKPNCGVTFLLRHA